MSSATAAAATPGAFIPGGSGVVGTCTVVYPQPADDVAPQLPCATHGYWNMRGLGAAVRLVLAYSGQTFADVRYQQGSAPEYSRQAWLDVKEKLELDFPNLPYYIEPATADQPELRLTQSTTILRHLGRKHNLNGSTLAEQAKCDLILDTAYDFKSILVDTAYSRSRPEALAHFAAKTCPHYLGQFEGYLARAGTTWCAGPSVTIADFFLCEMVAQTAIMVPGVLAQYANLERLLAQFQALPAIAQYQQSPQYLARPLNNMAGLQ